MKYFPNSFYQGGQHSSREQKQLLLENDESSIVEAAPEILFFAVLKNRTHTRVFGNLVFNLK